MLETIDRAVNFDYVVLGNPLRAWLLALGVAVGAFVVLNLVRVFIAARARAWAARRGRGVTDLVLRLVARTSVFLVIALALMAAAAPLVLDETAERVVLAIVAVGIAIQAVMWGRVVLDFGIAEVIARREAAEGQPDPALATAMGTVRFVALVVLYTVAVLVVLGTLDVDVTAAIASLGIGGIAVALAVQNILSDLFGSLTIVLDKPFVVGDFIIVGDQLGTVEKVGLKTTRVRALSGEQLVFANTDLLGSRVRNFKRMQERRVVFTLGVVHETPPEKVELVSRLIREAIEAQPRTRFDRAHFFRFGPSSLDYEAVYYMLVPDYNPYMDTQQAINLHLLREFERHGIQLARPTQTLFVASLPPTATGAPAAAS